MFGEINIGLVKSRSMTVFLLGMNLAALIALMKGGAPLISEIEHIPPMAIILSKGTGIGVGIAADIYGGAAS